MSFGIRFRFARDKTLKYIAHLDMLRLFERALRRSGLPVAYSQGFNPRMKIIFGLPMSIGLSSEAEYADIELDFSIPPADFSAAVNRNLPIGMSVIEAVDFVGNENVMACVAAARYIIEFKPALGVGTEQVEKMLTVLLESEQVPVMKKGKKGLAEVNIRPLIFSASLSEAADSSWSLDAFICAGASNNLRPDLMMEGWGNLTANKFSINSIHRTALYANIDNEWLIPTDPRICTRATVSTR